MPGLHPQGLEAVNHHQVRYPEGYARRDLKRLAFAGEAFVVIGVIVGAAMLAGLLNKPER